MKVSLAKSFQAVMISLGAATIAGAAVFGIGNATADAQPAVTQMQAQTSLKTSFNLPGVGGQLPNDYVTCKCVPLKDGRVICWGHQWHPGSPPPGAAAPYKCYKDQP
jgi:hypothetical protein